jgi:hypothetical protein
MCDTAVCEGQDKIIYDYVQIKDKIRQADWGEVLKCKNVDIGVDRFVNIMTTCINGSVNKNKPYKNSKYKKLKPWITSSLIELIRRRNKLHLLVRKNRNDTSLMTQYTKIRGICKWAISEVKYNYYGGKISNAGSNLKKNGKLLGSVPIHVKKGILK